MMSVRQTWHSTGSSGPVGNPLKFPNPVRDWALFANHSTLVATSTQLVSLQSAIESSGPWFIEGSTILSSLANVSTCVKLAATGPSANWARAYLHDASTGDYDFLIVGFD
jgi:hypothetical protein